MVSNGVSILTEDRMLDVQQKPGVCLFILVVQCGANDQYVSTSKTLWRDEAFSTQHPGEHNYEIAFLSSSSSGSLHGKISFLYSLVKLLTDTAPRANKCSFSFLFSNYEAWGQKDRLRLQVSDDHFFSLSCCSGERSLREARTPSNGGCGV